MTMTNPEQIAQIKRLWPQLEPVNLDGLSCEELAVVVPLAVIPEDEYWGENPRACWWGGSYHRIIEGEYDPSHTIARCADTHMAHILGVDPWKAERVFYDVVNDPWCDSLTRSAEHVADVFDVGAQLPRLKALAAQATGATS